MGKPTIYESLVARIRYASNSHSLALMNEAHGMVKMAGSLGAITKNEGVYLSGNMICSKHLNNAEWLRQCEQADSYEHKIEIIFSNNLEYNGDHQKAIQDVKTWLCCEWQSGAIEDMREYTRLLPIVDEIAERMIKEL